MKNIGDRYDWQGMLIISILMIIGGIILYFTGCGNINNFNDLYNYIYSHGFEAIISVFFIAVGLYCWVLFINNVIIKPKKEILYLFEIDDTVCCFLNKKGKKFYFNNDNYDVNKYYEVLKTHDNIKEVIDISVPTFNVPKPKESYWLNLYTPMGNFENMCLLPIAYVILLPGLLSFWMSEGFVKVYGVIFMIPPMYLIAYDLIYKIRENKI